MNISITLPDEIANDLEQQWGNLPRFLLETVTVQAYRSEIITRAQVGRLLDLTSRFAVDEFLAQANAPYHYSETDLEDDLRTMAALRAEGKLQQS
ncbi:MAG: UPF0175 family protein [Cyanobacteria bacterium P01_A01_bin.105]